MKLVVVKKF
uniref:Uncharacterized protein n=1 Tax=Anguilla anguilla TaxID=7936 RepID=A0A0E9XMA6_ANGAN